MCWAVEKNVMNEASKGSAESPANMPRATGFQHHFAAVERSASHVRAAVPGFPLTFL
jgi:hypothetical protein